jgi:hypothetical protein
VGYPQLPQEAKHLARSISLSLSLCATVSAGPPGVLSSCCWHPPAWCRSAASCARSPQHPCTLLSVQHSVCLTSIAAAQRTAQCLPHVHHAAQRTAQCLPHVHCTRRRHQITAAGCCCAPCSDKRRCGAVASPPWLRGGTGGARGHGKGHFWVSGRTPSVVYMYPGGKISYLSISGSPTKHCHHAAHARVSPTQTTHERSTRARNTVMSLPPPGRSLHRCILMGEICSRSTLKSFRQRSIAAQ